MKKCILKLELHDNKDKRKALKIVSALSGIDSITVNMKDHTLIMVGTADPINVVSKLRKFWTADIVSVGPAKEPEKKEEAKKDDGKKEEGKKDDGKKDEGKKEEGKKDEGKKEDEKKEGASKEEAKKDEGDKGGEKKKLAIPQPMPGMYMPYRPYYQPMNTYHNYQQHHPYQQYQQYQSYQQYQPYQQRHHSIEENPNGCVIF